MMEICYVKGWSSFIAFFVFLIIHNWYIEYFIV